MIIGDKMAKKHILMAMTYIKVMIGLKKEMDLIIPDSYVKSIYDINYEKLRSQGITNLLFDVDNTIAIVDDHKTPKELIELFNKLKKQGFQILLISNNHEDRVLPIAQSLDVPMLSDADKPEAIAYDRALVILKGTRENTVAIGDQMLSDIVGAKKYGLYTILVDQLSSFNNLETGTAKGLQDSMVKKTHKKNLFSYKQYY